MLFACTLSIFSVIFNFIILFNIHYIEFITQWVATYSWKPPSFNRRGNGGPEGGGTCAGPLICKLVQVHPVLLGLCLCTVCQDLCAPAVLPPNTLTPSCSRCAWWRKSCETIRELRMKHSRRGSFWNRRWRTWSTSWRPRVISKMTAADSSSRWRSVGQGLRERVWDTWEAASLLTAQPLGSLWFLFLLNSQMLVRPFLGLGKMLLVYRLIGHQSWKKWWKYNLVSSLSWRGSRTVSQRGEVLLYKGT